ncbi:MAG: CHASE3 domain-containing protein [Thermoanaerobaculia bacterium]
MKIGPRMIVSGFCLALSLLVGIGLVGYMNTKQIADSLALVSHTREVLEQLEHLVLTVADAESSRRAFLLSNDPGLLKPYHDGIVAAPRQLAALRRLTAENAGQQQRLDLLEQLVQRRLSQLSASLQARIAQQASPETERAETIEGAELSALLRRAAFDMERTETLLLNERQARSKASTRDALVTYSGGLVLSVILLTWIFGLLRREVAERTAAEAELDRYFMQSLELLCIATFDGYFTRLNPAWEKTLGFTPAELRAVPFLSFVHPDDLAATQREAARLVDEGTETLSFLNRYRCRDGSYRWFHWNAVPDRERKLLYATARDVTEQKLAEAQIRELNRELEKRIGQVVAVNKELEAFSYSVSHDLRSPLRSMDGFSQAVLEDYRDKLDERGVDFLNRIRGAATRMGELIDALLSLARVSRAELRPVEVDLSKLANEVLAELRIADPDRQVEVSIAPGLVVQGDTALLRLTMQNLLGNAWKYSSREPQARIAFARTTSDGGSTVFSVKDNGAGFDMAYAGKLFGAFQRLHAASEFAGTGIGLATVKRIILRHGGSVWAESALGQGATFHFTLEAGLAPSAAEPPEIANRP